MNFGSREISSYFAKEGYVEPFNLSVRGNPLVDQTHQEEGTLCASVPKD